MTATTLHLHTAFKIAPVDPRIFGGFIEHLGRCVYEGLFDPGSPRADKQGFRTDTLDALGKLNMTLMRYPGGNFASAYHWTDGVGPRDKRPTLREPAWQSTETNQFGTDEYVAMCRKMNWTPMIAANLGSGSPEEARHWVEYCNSPAGTKYADMRAANGHVEPHGVKLWCLGNEMDGWWQTGFGPPDYYATRANQAAFLMKNCDSTIELVACGSCGIGLSTYMSWDYEVLHTLGDYADYLSLHRYVGNPDNDTPNFLAVTNSIDTQIEQMDAICRVAQARRKAKKRAYLAFDEWNVWYKDRMGDGKGKKAPHLLEEIYNLEDALVVAGFLNSFIRHADVVKIANIAQVVNVIAPLLTNGDKLLIQSTYWPFEMISKRRDGISLRPTLDGPRYEAKEHGSVNFIDSSAILGDGILHVFVTNREIDKPHELTVHVADASIASVESAEIVYGSDPKAANSFEKPGVVVKRDFKDGVRISNGKATLKLPPLSFAAVTLRLG